MAGFFRASFFIRFDISMWNMRSPSHFYAKWNEWNFFRVCVRLCKASRNVKFCVGIESAHFIDFSSRKAFRTQSAEIVVCYEVEFHLHSTPSSLDFSLQNFFCCFSRYHFVNSNKFILHSSRKNVSERATLAFMRNTIRRNTHTWLLMFH